MFDSTIEDDRYGSIAFLDGSAAPDPGPQAVERRRRRAASARRIALTDSAASILTDFTWDAPVTVAADRFIGDALQDRIEPGFRAPRGRRGGFGVAWFIPWDIGGGPLGVPETGGVAPDRGIGGGPKQAPWG